MNTSQYRTPEITLLSLSDAPFSVTPTAAHELQLQQIINALQGSGIAASPVGIICSPRVTRYTVSVTSAQQARKIRNMRLELAMQLPTSPYLRILSSPDDALSVFIEIPNDTPTPVRLGSLIVTEIFRNASATTVPLGVDVAGSPVYADIAKMPHLLIAGAAGTGKSVLAEAWITSLLYHASPDRVRLLLIDPTRVDFDAFQSIPHLLSPVIHDARQALGALNWAAEEMDRRYRCLEKASVYSIDRYNALPDTDLPPMPHIVIMISEMHCLTLSYNGKVWESALCLIAQKARAVGIHLVIASQRLDLDVFTSAVQSNVPARIAFAVPQAVDSVTILGESGAETLLGKGDMLYRSTNGRICRIQAACVTADEIGKVTASVCAQNAGFRYDEEAIRGIEAATASLTVKERDRDAEEKAEHAKAMNAEKTAFYKAVELAIEYEKISTLLVQRKLSTGYGAAARIIAKMQEVGIVSQEKVNGAYPLLLSADAIRDLLPQLSERIDFSDC